MFGKKRIDSPEVQIKKAVIDEQPDLVVPQQRMGMQGFTEDAPVSVPKARYVEARQQAVPVRAPAPVVEEPVIQEQYQIISAEMLPDNLFRYVIVTNKVLGEVGGIYDI